MRSICLIGLTLLSVSGITVSPLPAAAQDAYPSRPIHIVVPFPAGGPSDVLTRLMGERMSKDIGQAIVVDNRPGANTLIGAELVAKAPPDGYTLLMAIDSTLVMNQYLYSHLPYDPIKDFAPVSIAAKSMGWIVVNASSPYKTVNDLIAKAKASPGKLNCGAGTISTKLDCVLFDEKFGVKTVLISFNGSANVAQGVLTGAADFVFDGTAAELASVQSGNLRALAKLDSRPFAPFPELPSLAAATGVDLGDLAVWNGLVAPHGTPPAIVNKLSAAAAKVLAEPDLKAKAEAVGIYPVSSTPAEFAAFIQHEAARWPDVVKKSGLHFD